MSVTAFDLLTMVKVNGRARGKNLPVSRREVEMTKFEMFYLIGVIIAFVAFMTVLGMTSLQYKRDRK